jgi:hypothetical protein
MGQFTGVGSAGKREAPGPAPWPLGSRGILRLASGSLRRLELLTQGAADPAAVGNVDAVGPRPCPDRGVVGDDLRRLGRRCTAAPCAASDLAAVVGVELHVVVELLRVLPREVERVLDAVLGEVDGLSAFAAVDVVREDDLHSLGHVSLVSLPLDWR